MLVIRVSAAWLLVLAACAHTPVPALRREPASAPLPDQKFARAAYRDAHANCDGLESKQSELASQTAATRHDDPSRQVHLIESYEALLLQTPVESATHAALLERILRRHIAEEQWAFRELVRQCIELEPTTFDALEYGTRVLRGAAVSMDRSAIGARSACARLRSLHPTFATDVPCPR